MQYMSNKLYNRAQKRNLASETNSASLNYDYLSIIILRAADITKYLLDS